MLVETPYLPRQPPPHDGRATPALVCTNTSIIFRGEHELADPAVPCGLLLGLAISTASASLSSASYPGPIATRPQPASLLETLRTGAGGAGRIYFGAPDRFRRDRVRQRRQALPRPVGCLVWAFPYIRRSSRLPPGGRWGCEANRRSADQEHRHHRARRPRQNDAGRQDAQAGWGIP